MSAHKLTPRVSPKLRVTAKLIQALNLLRLTTSALKEYLDKSISENPLLQPTDLENLQSKIKSLTSSSGRDSAGKIGLTSLDEINNYSENLKFGPDSLHDHLLHQLKTSFLNDNELAIGENIIEFLYINCYLIS